MNPKFEKTFRYLKISEPYINPESRRLFSEFMDAHEYLDTPGVTIDVSGCVVARWGVVRMLFAPVGFVSITAPTLSVKMTKDSLSMRFERERKT